MREDRHARQKAGRHGRAVGPKPRVCGGGRQLLRIVRRSGVDGRVVAATVVLVIGAWGLLWMAVDMSGSGTMGMAAPAWIAGWALMTAAMMGPSAWWFARAAARTQRAAIVLGLAYLVVWVLVGVAAYALALVVGVLGDRAPAAPPVVAGAGLGLAGAYQLTPLKDRCLRRCRVPLGVLLGVRGRLRLPRAGAVYALWCVACCAPLMAALVVAGLMGPWWVALVAAYLVLERAGEGALVSQVAGVCLVVLGVLVATGPALSPVHARIAITHERRKRRIEVSGSIEMAERAPVAVAEPISCGIPGHDHPGEELVAETLRVDSGPLRFRFSGRCGFASDFDYRSEG